LTKVLGSQVGRIMALAKGIDPRPVTPERVAKSVSNETTFSCDLTEFSELEAVLERLCGKLAKRLKSSQLTGATVTLKLKRSDHRIITRAHSLETPTDKAHILFDIGRRLLVPETQKSQPYRLLGIGVSHFNQASSSSFLDLNDEVNDKRNRLEAAVDRLQGKLGDSIIQSGRQFSRQRTGTQNDDTA
jgi:DNA polymerase-4